MRCIERTEREREIEREPRGSVRIKMLDVKIFL